MSQLNITQLLGIKIQQNQQIFEGDVQNPQKGTFTNPCSIKMLSLRFSRVQPNASRSAPAPYKNLQAFSFLLMALKFHAARFEKRIRTGKGGYASERGQDKCIIKQQTTCARLGVPLDICVRGFYEVSVLSKCLRVMIPKYGDFHK